MGTQCLWSNHIWNPWKGCHRVSSGCQNCYMFRTLNAIGRNPDIVLRANSRDWELPYRLRSGYVQVCSQSDFFIQDADDWREEAWGVMRDNPQLTYQILTKRPERIERHLPPDWGGGWSNVWLGVSTEDQATLDIRAPRVLRVPAAKYFASAQPLLEPLSIRQYLGQEKISTVLAGCESGPKSRRTDPLWFSLLKNQCDDAGVTYFLVQEEKSRRVERSPFYDGRSCHGWQNFYPFSRFRSRARRSA